MLKKEQKERLFAKVRDGRTEVQKEAELLVAEQKAQSEKEEFEFEVYARRYDSALLDLPADVLAGLKLEYEYLYYVLSPQVVDSMEKFQGFLLELNSQGEG